MYHAADELFFFAARATALEQFDGPACGPLGCLQGDMGAMGPAFRPIRGQAGGTGDPGGRTLRGAVLQCVPQSHHGHRPGGAKRAELIGPPAQPGDQGVLTVRNHRFEHGPRGPGHFQQLGNRPAPAPANAQDNLRRGVVDLFSELKGRYRHHSRGRCFLSIWRRWPSYGKQGPMRRDRKAQGKALVVIHDSTHCG